MTTPHADAHKCGFVALAGRPNVGKSTLVNRILGIELSVVTPKAQTTRNRITAIHTLPHTQLILVDTPGIHDASKPLNRALVRAAVKTVEGADLALMIAVPRDHIPDDDLRIIEIFKEARTDAILAINKIDLVSPPTLLPVIERYADAYDFRAIVPISSLNGDGVDRLEEILIDALPPGPPLYPEDDVSDLPLRFFIAELVREQVTNLTKQELPYSTAVMVEAFKERPNSVLINADIHVERESQKRILVGRGGSMIKKIGIAAREKIEAFLEKPVRLELFVKVSPDWSRDPLKLEEFGYRE